MSTLKQNHFCLGHVNFGMLTTHVPHSGYKVFTNFADAETACYEARKRNPQMKVLLCTPMGMPVRVAKLQDR